MLLYAEHAHSWPCGDKSKLTFLGLAFNVYRLIPILPELREVMDWVFTDTALSLLNWLKVQEIYAQLYLVKVQRNRERVRRRIVSLD